MKQRWMIATGCGLIVVCLAGAWFRAATPPPEIAVRFEGYEHAVDRGWLAVFRATNGAPYAVQCLPSFPPQTNDPPPEVPLLPAIKTLASHGGVTWLFPVAYTNAVRQLRIECQDQRLNLLERLAQWLERRRRKDPNVFVLPQHGRKYEVTCLTGVAQGARKLEGP